MTNDAVSSVDASRTDENGAVDLEPEATEQAPAESEQPSRTRPSLPTLPVSRTTAAGGAAVALAAFAGAAVFAALRSRGPGFRLEPGERVALSVRPRKTAWRYLGSLGLWEAQRRATRFTVTNNRLVIEEGLLKRVVSGVPLAAIQHVLVRTGPWEGTVDVLAPGARGQSSSRIGPLGPTEARSLAAAITSRGADLEEAWEG
jgi:hypothetical protein